MSKSLPRKRSHGEDELIPTISHWIGQDAAVRRFKIALEASWNDGTKLPHMLFVGCPGTGKTLLANLAAKEMGVQLHERIAQVVNSMGALNGLLLQAQDKDIVFLDEIHELLPSVQTLLYRAMEGQQISLRTRDEQTLTMPLKDVTIIGCSTDEYRLLSPLRQRFKLSIPFTTYDEGSLAQITQVTCGRYGTYDVNRHDPPKHRNPEKPNPARQKMLPAPRLPRTGVHRS